MKLGRKLPRAGTKLLGSLCGPKAWEEPVNRLPLLWIRAGGDKAGCWPLPLLGCGSQACAQHKVVPVQLDGHMLRPSHRKSSLPLLPRPAMPSPNATFAGCLTQGSPFTF